MFPAEPVVLQGHIMDDGGPTAQGPGGQRTEYPASSRYPTASVVSMVSTLNTTMRSLGPSKAAGSRLCPMAALTIDRKSTRLNSSHANISYAVFCLKKKKNNHIC